MTNPSDEKRRAAVHEAGHAVLSVVSEAANPGAIWLRKESDGRWVGRTYKPHLNDASLEQLADEGRAIVGGSKAEEIVLGSADPVSANRDVEVLRQVLEENNIPRGEQRQIVALIQSTALDLASDHEESIRRVADALEEKGSLSQAALHQLVGLD